MDGPKVGGSLPHPIRRWARHLVAGGSRLATSLFGKGRGRRLTVFASCLRLVRQSLLAFRSSACVFFWRHRSATQRFGLTPLVPRLWLLRRGSSDVVFRGGSSSTL
ncbi:NAD/NADP-dependent betaine aldehydedehydrogenase [Striga asiatica]|uniref:NAD/NADP-dependent betaine aldehydedehydrogenase n=1 Tax=Striga asiatica TaxID=4170 RepID=A0A5A7Q9I4_STRAF|nr:NAD/NADP-dependent betaine aldehydedehydrogenase [Striga asiatica]